MQRVWSVLHDVAVGAAAIVGLGLAIAIASDFLELFAP